MALNLAYTYSLQNLLQQLSWSEINLIRYSSYCPNQKKKQTQTTIKPQTHTPKVFIILPLENVFIKKINLW